MSAAAAALEDHIMIGLQSIEKVYRTDRIETVALAEESHRTEV